MYKLIALLTLFICFNVIGQSEPEVTLALLENDNIAEVNINQESTIQSVGDFTDITKEAFKDIKSTQKIAVLLTIKKEGEATVEIFSNPKITDKTEAAYLKKVRALKFGNTRLVDFPMLLLLNSSFEEKENDFKDFVSPVQKRIEHYQNSSLKEMVALNKAYAIEVLSVLGAYQEKVSSEFVGVKNMGNTIGKTDFSKTVDLSKLTQNNPDYWRAILEMNIGNQLLPASNIFALVAQGKIDYAMKYLEIYRMFSDPKTIPNDYLEELSSRIYSFNTVLTKKVKEGLQLHDKGNYKEAIIHYEAILKDYPNSAWTQYELFYSKNALALENKEIDNEDRTDWDKSKVGIYNSNPLYNMDVRASNGKEAYLLFRRMAISDLFKSKDAQMKDVYEYANIALDLEVYDFAAHLYWISVCFDKSENDALKRFLYTLEKLEVTNIKSNFKGNFEKEFKKIDKTRKKEMEESSTYKVFKKK